MTPKKAVIIVLILFLAIAGFFIFLYLKKQAPGSNESKTKSAGQIDVNTVIDKKNNNQSLSPQEQQAINQAIQDKIDEKVKALQNPPVGSKNSNTKENIDFLLNPRTTAEKELGVKASAALSPTASSSQVNDIDLLNPSKKK